MIRDIEKLILREIGAVSRCIYSIGDIKYKDKNLQRGQFIFLLRICENQGINLIELSNLMKVDKTTSTKAVQKLINEGYLEKKVSKSSIAKILGVSTNNLQHFIKTRKGIIKKLFF